jgi:hypothetical protein
MKLRLSLLKPGAVVDQRRGVIDVVFGSTMNRMILQYWNGHRWVDIEVGEDDQKMPEPEVGI